MPAGTMLLSFICGRLPELQRLKLQGNDLPDFTSYNNEVGSNMAAHRLGPVAAKTLSASGTTSQDELARVVTTRCCLLLAGILEQ